MSGGRRTNKRLSPITIDDGMPSLVGFDIETYDRNKRFLCASFHDGTDGVTFKDTDGMISYLKQCAMSGTTVVATNLSFDLFGLLHGKVDMRAFDTMFRGSDLIKAECKISPSGFVIPEIDAFNPGRLRFIDTMSFDRVSVEKMGKMLGLPKLSKPSFLGDRPCGSAEWDEMAAYNERDSMISRMYMRFLYSSFLELGAGIKNTLASTSLSLYRSKYLDSEYHVHDIPILIDIFKAYYGGRTECFVRGPVSGMTYADINSLYPSVMMGEFPDPQSIRVRRDCSIDIVREYMGMSDVTITVPYSRYPLLPFRVGGADAMKVIFPYGTMRGWWTHAEINRSMELGGTVSAVHKSIYFRETCRPFMRFVRDMYRLRLQYQKKGDPMERVVKILMNSLYGKFGQRFTDMESFVPLELNFEDLKKYDHFEVLGDFVRLTKDIVDPSSCCFPEWACYVTAYGRLKLHDALVKYDAVYCDTDSIVTSGSVVGSSELGEFKVEMSDVSGVLVRPKMYALRGSCGGEKDYVKVKGLGMRLDMKGFFGLVRDPIARYDKFVRLKESVRRGLIPNELVAMTKRFGLDDDKREWPAAFSVFERQDSVPHKV